MMRGGINIPEILDKVLFSYQFTTGLVLLLPNTGQLHILWDSWQPYKHPHIEDDTLQLKHILIV